MSQVINQTAALSPAAAKPVPSRSLLKFLKPGRLQIGLLITLVVVFTAVFGPYLIPFDPETQDVTQRLRPASAEHWLGTDSYGRDMLSRVISGGQVSLKIGILSMILAVGFGVLIGAVAGYCGGTVDTILMRFTELVMIFPTFFLLILAVAVFGRSVNLLILLISFTAWPAGARIVRGEVMKVKERDFVLSALTVGSTHLRILFRHILPNVIGVIIVSATVRVGSNILAEAGLSYLGLGVQPPLASWGNMIADGASVFRTSWWITGFPALAIFVTVFGFNLLGEGLRDYFNPRER
jgi:peptide/nickel transport system permease protein